jgi:hypothetical protein
MRSNHSDMGSPFDRDFEFNTEEMFKISSFQVQLYLPPEEDVEFSTSVTINHPKHPMKQATIIQLPSMDKKNTYMKKLTQENLLEIKMKKEIIISSIWIKARLNI